MIEPKKGARVLIVEGADKGTEGELHGIYRQYDPATCTTGKRCTIKVTEGEGETEHTKLVRTRLSWVREI